MKISTTPLTGIDASLSPATAPDGTLHLSIGLIHEDGALRPIPQPAPVGITIPRHSGEVFLHKADDYSHYIFARTQDAEPRDSATAEICYTAPGLQAPVPVFTLPPAQAPVAFAAVGHTVLISTASATHFIIWREEEGRYLTLGTGVPQPHMLFLLRGQAVHRTFPALAFQRHTTSGLQDQAPGPSTYANLRITLPPEPTDRIIEAAFDTYTVLESGQNYYIVRSNSSEGSAEMAVPWDYLAVTAIQGAGTERVAVTPYEVPGQPRKRGIQYDETLRDIRIGIKASDAFSIMGQNPGKKISMSFNLYKQPQKGFEDFAGNEIANHTQENLDTAFAIINQFRAEECEEKGRFIHPFFVRYGLRLFDGTLSALSDPVLIVPNSGYAPFVNYVTPGASAVVSELFARLSVPEGIENWRDIIQQIEVFATEPVYPYDQGAPFDEHTRLLHHFIHHGGSTVSPSDLAMQDKSFVQGHAGYSLQDQAFLPAEYRQINALTRCASNNDDNAFFWRDSDNNRHAYILRAAPRTPVQTQEDLTSKSAYWLIAKIPFDEMLETAQRSSPWKLRLIHGATKNIQSGSPLREDEASLHAQQGAGLFAFNGRIHAFGGHTSLPLPTPPWEQRAVMELTSSRYVTDIIVSITTDDGERTARRSFTSHQLPPATSFSWFFYPHPGARTLRIVTVSAHGQTDYVAYSTPLRRHDFLYGAFFYRGTTEIVAIREPASGGPERPAFEQASSLEGQGFIRQPLTPAQYAALPGDNRATPKPSTIYVSEPGNPFSYLPASVVSVAGHVIRALSSSAVPLSEGQFGQFPLYVFTDHGVWAAENGAAGGYYVRQPVTRDVILPQSRPLQTDGAVLFSTSRGIMQLSGRNTSCITEPLTRHTPPLIAAEIPGVAKVFEEAGINVPQPMPSFADIAAQARLVYDYRHQRVILFSPGEALAYVLSMRSGQWGQMMCAAMQPVLSFPSAQAVMQSGEVADFAADNEQDTPVAFITAPIKPGGSFALKNPRQARILGKFGTDPGHGATFLWASRDYNQWHAVAASRGPLVTHFQEGAYMAFRIGYTTTLLPFEHIIALAIHYNPDHGLEQDLPTE